MAKVRRVLSLLLLCSSLAGVARAVDNAGAVTLYRKAYADYKGGDVDLALTKLEEATGLDPDYQYPLLLTGRIHQEKFEVGMHHYAEALDAFEKLTRHLVKYPPKGGSRDLYLGHYYKGLLQIKGGDYSDALMELEKFLAVYPDFDEIAKVHNARGIACYYLDRYDQAISCFKRALETEPAFAEARFNLRSVYTRVVTFNEALALYRAGESLRALKSLTGLGEIAPRYLAARRLEAKILTDMKKPEEAIAVYEEILGFQPGDPETYRMRIDLARTLIGLGRKAPARAVLLENLARFPNIEDARARMEVVSLIGQLGNEQ